MITDHKLLIAIFKKDITSLSYRLQRILLRMYQYNMGILYNPVLQPLIIDYLSRQNYKTETKSPSHMHYHQCNRAMHGHTYLHKGEEIKSHIR